MKASALFLSCALLAAPWAYAAEVPSSSASVVAIDPSFGGFGGSNNAQTAPSGWSNTVDVPFSRIAVSGGFSTLGVNVQVATNVNRFMNLRFVGNGLSYVDHNYNDRGINIDIKPEMATAGVMLDIYPFPHHGLRLSSGLLLYNQNHVNLNGDVPAGNSFSLAGKTYYSETGDPLSMHGRVDLNTNKPALIFTTGWGNMIPRAGGHWSFPLEIGGAFTGTSLGMDLKGGACLDKLQTQCSDVNNPTNASVAKTINTAFTGQKANWRSDVNNDLGIYPIISFGVAYSFRIR